jgi:predicted MFS family arabinose efflux permease
MTPATRASAGRRAAARLVPWAAILLAAAASIFGLITVRAFDQALAPELDNRSRLIGTIVRGNIQRALDLGIPLDQMRGAARYLERILERFPEVSRIAIRDTDGRVASLGERGAADTIKAIDLTAKDQQRPGAVSFRADAFSFPILSHNTVVGEILIEGDRQFVERQFRNVFLDVLVFILAALLAGFEIMLAVVTGSVVKPLDRLRALLEHQCAGDFSVRLAHRTATGLDRVAARFSDHAIDLNARFARLTCAGTVSTKVSALGDRFRLSGRDPVRLRFADVADSRLPLFLFVLGAELSKSFLPLYVQRVTPPDAWLPEAVVISLPLVAYLIAVVLLSPIAGWLTSRFPARRIFLAAAGAVTASQLGLSSSDSALEIVLWQGFAGAGFAVASIACQDHALHVAGTRERGRAVGGFIAVIIAGTFCGTAIGGVIADRLGQANVFLAGAALIVVAGAVAVLMLPDRVGGSGAGGEKAGSERGSMLAALGNGSFLALLVGIAIPANVLVAAFLWYLVPLMLADIGSTPADIGRALMGYYLLVALLTPRVAELSERRGNAAALAAAGGVLCGLSLLAAAHRSEFWPIVVAVAVAGLGQALLRAPVVELTLRIAEPRPSGVTPEAMLGAMRTFERVGSMLGLVLAAALAAETGYSTAAEITGYCILAGALAFTVSRFRLPPG